MVESALIKDVELFLDEKPSVYALRDRAKRCLINTGFPLGKTEQYKYTDIKEIIDTDFVISAGKDECEGNCCCGKHKDDFFIEIAFCKGQLHVEDYVLPDGINIIPLPVALYENEFKQYILTSFDLEKYPFGALNGMYLEQGICVEVEDGVKLNDVIKINYKNCGANNIMMHIHNVVVLGKKSRLEIVESFSSENKNKYFMNVVNEIYLKENSLFKHYKIQKESTDAFHIALNVVKIFADAKYEQFYLSNGAKISRNETLVDLEKENARADVYSAYVAKALCQTDITTNINHNEAKTFSNQYAKAVLEGASKASFQGKIKIKKDAIKVEGNQLHKALYLSDDAVLNCKPELEIYADDVKCSHGATCGEIDREQLFYLTSRGINNDDAMKMLIDAHLKEITSLIDNKKIAEIFGI